MRGLRRRRVPVRPRVPEPRHVRLTDAQGRPLDVRPDQVSDLIQSGLATQVLPERFEVRPGSREDMLAGRYVERARRPAVYRLRPRRLDALRRLLAELETPERTRPHVPPRRIVGYGYLAPVIIDDPPKRPRP